MEFTKSQKTAVEFGNSNLLLSAAAGSGKTAALTGRIVELLTSDRADLSEMLIVTFSRAAAAEMRGRLSKRLRELAAEGRHVSRHIAALPSAEISTIHSFLYKAIRPYFNILGLSGDFRIADENSVKKLKAEVMRDVVDDFFSGVKRVSTPGASSFPAIADIIGQARDAEALDAELLKLAGFLSGSAETEELLLRFADSFSKASDDFSSSPFGKALSDTAAELAAHYTKIFEETADEFSAYPKIAEKYGPALDYMISWLRRLRTELDNGADYNRLAEILKDYFPPSLGRLTIKDANEISDRFKYFKEIMKKDIEALSKNCFVFTELETRTAGKITAELLRGCADVLHEYFRELDSRKKSMSMLEYGDLENLAIRLFIAKDGSPTNAARETGGRFKFVFIDEYQDTNRVQDNIFRALTGSSVRFMVGDIKQSIYRFRGAEPEVFSEYRESWDIYSEDDSAEERCCDKGYTVFLQENFRCSRPVVDFVNEVAALTLPYGGIPYGDGDRLIFSRNTDSVIGGGVEVCLAEVPRRTSSDSADSDTDDEYNGRSAEAAYVASRINEFLHPTDGTAPAEPKDIAIIMRSPSSGGDAATAFLFENELKRYSIPVKTTVKTGLCEHSSVLLVMCLMNCADNPFRDIYLTGALRSPVLGFTISDIVELRKLSAISEDSDAPLYTALCKTAEADEESPLSEKCRRAARWISQSRASARGMTADKYLELLIEDTGIRRIEGIRGNREEYDALNHLITEAKAYESVNKNGTSAAGGLSGFISYINETGGAEEKVEAGGVNAVSIMSIHASKGLEFPICFVSGCGKGWNTEDEKSPVLFDRKLGIAMYLPDDGGLLRCRNLFRTVIARKKRIEMLEEEMRMLYVALTRARERLIITAKVSNADTLLAKAEQTALSPDKYGIMRMSSYIEWILGACARNRAFTVKIIEKSACFGEDSDIGETDGESVCATPPDTDTIGLFEERFAHTYEYSHLSRLPAKLTVSKLTPVILDDEPDELSVNEEAEAEDSSEAASSVTEGTRPRFMTGFNEVTAAERGSATHIFMQFANYELLTEKGGAAELKRLVSERYMSEKMAEMVDLYQINRFVSGELMSKLRRSTFVKREFRFNVLMNADEFTSDPELSARLRSDNVKLTVQGVVDCVFRDPDDGGLVLVDYKTDYISPAERKNREAAHEKLRSRHSHQIKYYAQACERMFGEKLARAEIYSTGLGECVAIE